MMAEMDGRSGMGVDENAKMRAGLHAELVLIGEVGLG